MPSAESPLRVLIVEDDADTTGSLVALFSAWGYVPRAAPNGPTALTAAPTFLPDVALIDLGLPEMDGYEVGRRLRALPGLERVSLVALTGHTGDEYRRRANEAGFTFYIVKPPNPDSLKLMLDALALKKTRRPAGPPGH